MRVESALPASGGNEPLQHSNYRHRRWRNWSFSPLKPGRASTALALAGAGNQFGAFSPLKPGRAFAALLFAIMAFKHASFSPLKPGRAFAAILVSLQE